MKCQLRERMLSGCYCDILIGFQLLLKWCKKLSPTSCQPTSLPKPLAWMSKKDRVVGRKVAYETETKPLGFCAILYHGMQLLPYTLAQDLTSMLRSGQGCERDPAR